MTALVSPGAAGHGRRPVDDGVAPTVPELGSIFARRVLPYVVVWFVVLAGAGWSLGHPLKSALAPEDGVSRWFAAHRSPGWNTVTDVLSHVANTGSIIVSTAAACLVYWLVTRRLRDVLPLAIGVFTQAGVFLLTTLVIDRPRPQVPKLDQSPPTSSFPSGHTGASAALYFGLVLLCVRRFPSLRARVLSAVGFGLIPFAVGTARLYRGMHHPSDVLFGLLNGLVCAVVAYLALRPAPSSVTKAAS